MQSFAKKVLAGGDDLKGIPGLSKIKKKAKSM
jgi:hypothetical protein